MMSCFRFIQFLFLVATLFVSQTDALAYPAIPSRAVRNISEQSKMGGYSYGESCLFGSSTGASSNMLWAGKKAAASSSSSSSQSNLPGATESTDSFGPDAMKRGPGKEPTK